MTLPTIHQTDLLTQALTHRSALNEKAIYLVSYERLEFLGDAVLELLTTEFLFAHFPQHNEGVLTAYRSALVRTEMLAKVSIDLGIDQLVIMGKGEQLAKGTSNTNILADVFEAFVGALYLDQGLEICKTFLATHLCPKIEAVITQRSFKDPKSIFQEKIQANGLPTPRYQVVGELGPDHNKKFTVRVLINNQVWGEGSGTSKQRAESAAAQNALEQMPK